MIPEKITHKIERIKNKSGEPYRLICVYVAKTSIKN